jgi:hypothetical protein
MVRGRPLRAVLRGTVVVCAIAWPAASRSSAGDASEPPAFCRRFVSSTWIDRIAAGPDGSVCVAGNWAADAALPGALAPPDGENGGFLTVFEPDGRVRWSRCLFDGWGWISDVAVAADGSIWVAATLGLAGLYDVQVTKLGPGGELLFVQDIRGAADDAATHLAIAANGDALLVGTTRSPDFPTVSAFQPQLAGTADGFVVRLRGDGSGIAWSSYLGGPGYDDANAVAVEPSGDLLVTTRALTGVPDYTFIVNWLEPIDSAALVRISGEGVPNSEVPLTLGKFGGAFDVVVAADGGILVGGALGFIDWDLIDGFILPVDPVGLSLGAPRIHRNRPIYGLAIGPDGSVLAGTDRDWREEGNYYRPRDGGFVHLTPDLGRVLRRVDREEGWGVRDVAFAPDGALCIAGRGGDAAVRFREPAADRRSGDEPFVARLPSSSSMPPARVRVVALASTEAELEWSQNGERVVRYEVEERVPSRRSFGTWTYRRLAWLPSSATRVRLSGLTPGATLHLRVVAVFASGVRSSAGVPTLRTPPVPVGAVVARVRARHGVAIDLRGPAVGNRTRYQLQRSVDFGPFVAVATIREFSGCDPACADDWRVEDVDPSIRGARVVYRARAVTIDPRVETPWRYSDPVWPR